MKLVSIKLNKKDTSGKDVPNTAVVQSREEYPYGFRITLEREQIKKLNARDYEVDDIVSIMAKGKVLSVRKEEMSGNEEDRHTIEIQITDMSLSSDGEYEKGFKEASKE